MLEGLHHVWMLRYRRIELETDDKEVVDILYRSSSSLQMSALVAEIFKWLIMGRHHGQSGVIFVYPPRSIMSRLEEERVRWLSERVVDDLANSRKRESGVVFDPRN
ncbi:hypothetical protein V6N12_066344 [Hibiscus sabdariffa]|uniref:RNase H type-1 domain-containing protein n=1 Tax=Hibiscus sabdariffa TaxID=183260 RepID=A0ABR2CPU3_9ROSI